MTKKLLRIPNLDDIKNAQERIGKYLKKSPLIYSEDFSKLTDAHVYIKLENKLPTSAFKVRGGINFVSKLCENSDYKNITLLAGSTGNHGQSIAYAGKLFNIPVVIVCPEKSNEKKVTAIKNLGAKIIFHGKDVFESWEYCEKLSKDKNYLYVHSVEEPDLFEGVGTIGLEVYDELPEMDCFIAAVGGGSGICGSSIALKSLDKKIKTYAVQSDGAPAAHDSFKEKKIISYPSLNTFAGGIATRSVYKYAFHIMQKYVDDVFLVSDDELKEAIKLIYKFTGNIAEGAGAASLAAVVKFKSVFKEKKVVCVISGGNIEDSADVV